MANSIEDIKALMNTKLGFARANKFLVTLVLLFFAWVGYEFFIAAIERFTL